MEREDHINKLRNKLNSKSVIEDMDALWNELEPRLPEPKKNRRVVFWLPIAGLLLVVFSIGFYLLQSKAAEPSKLTAETIITDEQTTANKLSDNNPDQIKSSTTTTSKTETSIADANSTKATEPLRNSEIVNNNTQTSSSKSSLNEPIISKENKFVSISKVNTSTYTPSINTASKQAETQNETIQESEQVKEITTSSNTNITKQQIAGNLLDNYQATNKQAITGNQSTKEESLKPLLFPTLTSLGIQDLSIENLYTSIQDVKTPNYAIINESKENVSNRNWQISLSTYALTDWNFSAQQGLTEYGTRINDLTSILPGYSLGGVLSIRSTHGFIFGLGIEQVRAFEKFKLDNSISTTESVLNEQAFVLKGQFIGNEQEVRKTVNQSALSYNEYSKTNLMPFIGYAIDRKFHYELALSPIISLRQNYSGYLIDENDLIISDLDHLYRTDKTILNGYAISTTISHQFMNNFKVGMRTQFRRMSKNVSQSNTDFDNSLSSLSIGLSLGYDF